MTVLPNSKITSGVPTLESEKVSRAEVSSEDLQLIELLKNKLMSQPDAQRLVENLGGVEAVIERLLHGNMDTDKKKSDEFNILVTKLQDCAHADYYKNLVPLELRGVLTREETPSTIEVQLAGSNDTDSLHICVKKDGIKFVVDVSKSPPKLVHQTTAPGFTLSQWLDARLRRPTGDPLSPARVTIDRAKGEFTVLTGNGNEHGTFKLPHPTVFEAFGPYNSADGSHSVIALKGTLGWNFFECNRETPSHPPILGSTRQIDAFHFVGPHKRMILSEFVSPGETRHFELSPDFSKASPLLPNLDIKSTLHPIEGRNHILTYGKYEGRPYIFDLTHTPPLMFSLPDNVASIDAPLYHSYSKRIFIPLLHDLGESYFYSIRELKADNPRSLESDPSQYVKDYTPLLVSSTADTVLIKIERGNGFELLDLSGRSPQVITRELHGCANCDRAIESPQGDLRYLEVLKDRYWQLWDLTSPDLTLYKTQDSSVRGLRRPVFSEDGTIAMASATTDSGMKVLDLRTNELLPDPEQKIETWLPPFFGRNGEIVIPVFLKGGGFALFDPTGILPARLSKGGTS